MLQDQIQEEAGGGGPNQATPYAGGGSGGVGTYGSGTDCEPDEVGVVIMDSRTQVVEVVLDQVDVQKDIMVVEDLVLSSSHILLDK